MLRQYFTITCRHLVKDKFYSLFLILGLGIGLGIFLVCIKNFLYTATADSFLQDAERIYCIVQKYQFQNGEDKHQAYVPYPLATTLKSEIPGVEESTRFFEPGRMVLSSGLKKFYENSIYFVDPNFLDFFTFDILSGNRKTMLAQPNSIVLTRAAAAKYFGQANPLGQLLTLDNKQVVVVTGVVENPLRYPSASSMRYDFLVSMETARGMYGPSLEQWDASRFTGFVRLRPGTNPGDLKNQMHSILQRYYPPSPESPKEMYLYPIKGIAFSAPHIEKYSGHIVPVYIIMLIMGFLFLSIVTINYINLSTSKYLDRLKEVGVRKVVGAQKFDIVKQFLSESISLSIVSIPLAIGVYNLINSALITRIGLDFNWSFWNDTRLIFFLILASILTGIIAGSYPAFYASSFQPMRMLGNTRGSSAGRTRLRNVLVVTQFFVSIVLIVCTIVWGRQAEFVMRFDTGYAKKTVIAVPLQGETKELVSLLEEKMRGYSDVLAVSASQGLPGIWMGTKTLVTENVPSNGITAYAHDVDYNFIETAGLRLLQGRSFAPDYHDADNLIINRLFADRMKWNDPVGKTLIVNDKRCAIIGMVDNYHFALLFSVLGLLGLVSFSLRKRTKEIGLRKVLGATSADIFSLLGKSFMKLVVISNILALPVAYLAIHSLLESAFSARVPIRADVFIWTIVLTVAIAFAAILSQTMRAAQNNPADSIRCD